MKAFQCKMCGTCCSGEGGITFQEHELQNISAHLGMDPKSFISLYCEQRNGRISIKTGLHGSCVFYGDGGKCRIHPVKPRVCSLWPFYSAIVRDRDNWETAKAACPGINPGCTFEEFVEQSKES